MPPSEGALAPKPEPLREIPRLRKKEKEKTWREEVNERVRSRRKKRSSESSPLPLFAEEPSTDAAAPPDSPQRLEERRVTEPAPETLAHPVRVDRGGAPERNLSEPIADVLLRPSGGELEDVGGVAEPPLSFEGRERAVPAVGRSRSEEDEGWPLELQPPAPEVRPVERPALLGERAQAAALDLSFLTTLWALVLYFAGRAAHVSLAGLRPSWNWLGSYLVFLGLTYAAYFTGTTGQTLGKILLSLRVVDTNGQPPGYLRALARALLGSVFVLAAGLGVVPMAFDPARRALHDRLFRTRVIRS